MAPEVGRAAADAGARAVGGVVRVRAARRRIAEKRGRLPQGAPLDRGAAAEAVTARGAGGRDAYQRDCDLYSGVICAISFTFCLLLLWQLPRPFFLKHVLSFRSARHVCATFTFRARPFPDRSGSLSFRFSHLNSLSFAVRQLSPRLKFVVSEQEARASVL